MKVKEYLDQARYLDMRIKSKLQQIDALNALATNCSSVISDMPRSPNKSTSKMSDAVIKIIDLQDEIRNDMDHLVSLKQEITTVIKSVPDLELQTLLEKRYLCIQSWEQIAVDMGFELRYLYKLHNKALNEIRIDK